MEETSRHTIYDLLPPVDQKGRKQAFREAYQYLAEAREDEDQPFPEIMFVALLNYHIDVFNKAKTMLTKGSFTVDMKPPENTEQLRLEHFYIVPIVKKHDKESAT